MSKRNVVLGVAVVSCVVVLAIGRAAERGSEQETPQTSADILKAELQVIDRARQIACTALEVAPPTPGQSPSGQDYRDLAILWSQRAVDAQRESGTKADYIAALEAHRDLLGKLLERAKALYEARHTQAMDMLDLQYRLLEADAQLLKAKSTARPK